MTFETGTSAPLSLSPGPVCTNSMGFPSGSFIANHSVPSPPVLTFFRDSDALTREVLSYSLRACGCERDVRNQIGGAIWWHRFQFHRLHANVINVGARWIGGQAQQAGVEHLCGLQIAAVEGNVSDAGNRRTLRIGLTAADSPQDKQNQQMITHKCAPKGVALRRIEL